MVTLYKCSYSRARKNLTYVRLKVGILDLFVGLSQEV